MLNHTPYSRGWQSARYAEFPQEIILEFGQTARVKQIQFLSHQYKISKKIELLIYNPNTSKKFKKIGYLSLDSNERSNYQARELKSVYIDHDCQKIKVILHSAWENNHNLFRQVGLISINVQGEYENKISDLNNNTNNLNLNLIKNKNNILEEKKNEEKNTFEDNIKFDPNTLQKLKGLNTLKDEAIANEDYDKAQTIKNAINRLKSVANQLLVLEERKQIAIKNEQYDQAKLLKFEIESLRNEAGNFDLNNVNANNNRKPSGNANSGFNKLKRNNSSNNNDDDRIDANYGGHRDINNKNNYDQNTMDENNDNNNNNQRERLNSNQGEINNRTPMGKDMRSNQNTKNKFDNNFNQDENNDNFDNNNNNNNSNSNFNNQPYKQQSDSRNKLNTPNNQNNSLSNLDNNNSNNNNFTNNSKKPNFKNNNSNENKSPVDVDKIVIKGNNQNFDDLLNEKMKEEKLNKQKNSKKDNKQQNDFNNQNNDENLGESDEIPEKEYPIAEPFIGIFSYDLVKLLFSKSWKKKEEGLKQIEKEISKYPKSSVINITSFGPENVLNSAFGVAEYILNSTLPQPAFAAMDLLKTALAKFGKESLINNNNNNKQGNSNKQDVSNKAEKLVGMLLEKTADANPKLKEKAELTINEFADSPLIGAKLVLNHLLSGKVKKTLLNSAKHLMSRLNLLNRNVETFGLESLEDLDALVKFAVNGFKNPNKDVRDSAFNLLMNIYKFLGDDVKKHFKDLRPAQVSALEDGFDGVEVVGMNKNSNTNNNNNNKNLQKEKSKAGFGAKALNQGSSGNLDVPEAKGESAAAGNKSAKGRNDNRRKSSGKNKISQEEDNDGILFYCS